MSPTADAILVDHRGRKYLTAEERTRFLAAVRSRPKPTVQTLSRASSARSSRPSGSGHDSPAVRARRM